MSPTIPQTEKAILNTLSFNKGYPLLHEELYELLITNELSKRVLPEEFEVTVKNLIRKGLIVEVSGYYTQINGSITSLIAARNVQNKYARQKIRDAKKHLNLLSKFQFIRFVGITGDVARGRCNENAKVELVVISAKGFEKVAKRVINAALKLKRKSNEYVIQSPFCLSESKEKETSILKAYEILMTKPLINKTGIFEKYIHMNGWIFNCFSNYPLNRVSGEYRITGETVKK